MTHKKGALRSTLCAVSLSVFAMSAQAVVLDDETTASSTLSTVQPSNFQPSTSAFSDQLIVKYKSSAIIAQGISSSNSIEQIAANSMGVKMKHLRTTATGAHVIQMPKNQFRSMNASQMQSMLASLQSDPNVEYAHYDRLLQPMATPNDTQYNNQWHYYEPTGGLNLPTAWDTSTGQGVVVAILDTGITAHPDLDANVLPGYDMISSSTIANDGNGRDSNPADTGDATTTNECNDGRAARSSSWHGTHVAGTVAAVSNNNLGVAGVAYDAKLLPVRVLGKCGGRTSDIADAIIWAAGGSVSGVPTNPNPAQVINLSLGGGGSCDPTSQSAINQAVSLGATVVVAAGNSATNASTATPANCSNVVTVAATGRNGGRASYSNFGNVVDVAAPGGDQNTGGISDGVLSTLNNGQTSPANPSYEYYQGTSMATPHVAGVAALMYAVDSSITPAEVESLLASTTRSFPASCSGCGAGIVDAAAAVAAADPGTGNPPTGGNELANGVAKTNLSGAQGSETRYTLEVPAGASNLSFVISGGSGDADLYVRFGAEPTTGTYDCRPFRNGNSETCDISNVQAGTYHVMLRGYAAFSGVSLVGSFDEGSTNQPDTISQSNISGARNAWVNFQLDVPAGQSSLVVSISGGSGDADLYVRRGANPTTSVYDCRPFRNGNNETCTINNPAAGTYFIRLRGYRAFSGVTLQAAPQ